MAKINLKKISLAFAKGKSIIDDLSLEVKNGKILPANSNEKLKNAST